MEKLKIQEREDTWRITSVKMRRVRVWSLCRGIDLSCRRGIFSDATGGKEELTEQQKICGLYEDFANLFDVE